MEIFQGTEGFGNVALGRIKILKRAADSGDSSEKEYDCQHEFDLYLSAKERVIELLTIEKDDDDHSLDAQRRFKGEAASLLMLINDHQLEDAIYGRIFNQKKSVKDAVRGAGDFLVDLLCSSKDSYLQSKGNDIKELTKKLITCLDGYDEADAYLPENCVLAARQLTSAEFLKLDKDRIKGLIVEKSSMNSHMAILAKAMNIPTILGCEIYDEWDGSEVCVDGSWRVIYVEPDEQVKDDMLQRIDEAHAKEQELLELKGRECVTRDGRRIHLYANISQNVDITAASDNDCEGIGLYRTESAYLNRTMAPTEEELFYEYRSLAMAFPGKGVTIRTVDLGTDNNVPYIGLKDESNAALGVRGIRLCLRNEDLFKTQIRAILRAAAYGNVSIILPMISAVKELKEAKQIIDECYKELISEDIPCKETPVGVMIETPASVMISDELAKHSAFLSIGTNDLTMYTLGVDRDNKELADICDYHHPAIIRMIRIVCENAHRCHTPVGICGELANDEELTSSFLEMGVDSLSIAPVRILPMRDHILKL